MAEISARWIKEGAELQKLLDILQGVLKHTLKSLPAQFSRERWDMAEVSGRWMSQGINHSLRLTIEEDGKMYVIRVTGSGWKDIEDQRVRMWKEQDFGGLPGDPPYLDPDKLRNLLEDARDKIDGWKEEDLKNRTPLPQRSPGVDELLSRNRPS